jgi:hypothetical protein
MSSRLRKRVDVGAFMRNVSEYAAAQGDSDPLGELPSPHSEPPPRLPIGALRFYRDQQPRDMLPPDEWDRLEALGENTPAGVLAALQTTARVRPASQLVLEHVAELAPSVRSEGILLPISVVPLGGNYVVLDGHCRAMAAALAGVADAPTRLESDPQAGLDVELTNVSHRFILNFTQQRLSPLESMRELCRVAELAQKVVSAQTAGASGQPKDALSDNGRESVDDRGEGEGLGDEVEAETTTEGATTPEGRRPGRTRAAVLEGAVRDLVLARTGLSTKAYHDLYRLRHLHPDAQALADGLSVNHLLAILTVPGDLQPMLVRLVQATNGSVQETRNHCAMVRQHGMDYLVEIYGRALRKSDQPRRRTALSWEPLLRPLPDDITPRISALRAELEALPERLRVERLRTLAAQRERHLELVRAFDDLLARYSAPSESEDPG